MNISEKIVNKMFDQDAFSQRMGIEIISVSKGYCQLKMKVRKEMTNGFDIAHGGIAYSIADSCLAFAANTDGVQSISIETSISHTKKVMSGDTLIAQAKEINKGSKTALYYITITNQDNIEIAHFKGTVFRTAKEWFPNK